MTCGPESGPGREFFGLGDEKYHVMIFFGW